MALLWAIIFLALGISLTVVWGVQVALVLKGIVPLLLIFLGLIFFVVGYSERKAARECDEAMDEKE
jgi:membrane protein DedA with SNARE-associated domain